MILILLFPFSNFTIQSKENENITGMRFRNLILIAFFLIFYNASAQQNYLVDWNYEGQSFYDFILKAESKFPVKFFFREEWLKGITLSRYENKRYLNEILDTLLNGQGLFHYSDESGNIILTKYFAIKPLIEEKAAGESYIPGLEYEEEDETKGAGGNIVIDLGNPADRDKPGIVTISGYITDQHTREPVAGATVQIPKLSAGDISNSYGFYSLSVPRGSYSMKFSFIGMKEKTVDVNVYGSGELNIEMRSVLIPLKEALITAERNVTLQRFEVGLEKIDVNIFRLLPTAMGESDIMKSVLLLPGVHSVGEGSAGFNVRGGSADQNLILLYGAPVYNSSHFFGFFSAVNPDIIRDVALFKGGIPARYGGRLASVLDITSRDGNRIEFAGNAGISPVTTHFVLEGPIKKDTIFYIIAGRTTYSNWLLGMLQNRALRNSKASFHDINVRLAYDINRNNKIDLSSYYSYDSFQFNGDTTYQYQNNIIALRWRHFFTSRLFTSLTLNNSFYGYNVSSTRVSQEAFKLSHKINSTGLKADFNWYTGRNEFNFGAEMTEYNVRPGDYMPVGDSSLVIPNTIQRQRALEPSLWFEDKYTLTDYLSVNAGIRLTSFLAAGPQTIYLYNKGYEKGPSSVKDTLFYGKNSIYKVYGGPEIRLSVNIKTDTKSSVKLNYNHTKQYLHMLSNTTSISPTDIWKLSDYHLRPQTADQVAAGYYRLLHKNRIEASAEIYYKKIRDMADFKGGTEIIMNEFIEWDLINVEGKAYGIELMLKKTEGRVRYNIGYTYSRVLVRSTSSINEEIINDGKWFPANFDRPHDLILTFNYLFSRRYSFSATYNYSTGRPVTYPVATYTIGDIVIMQYSDRNKYRLPDYSRLDISLKVSGNLKAKKIANPHWIFSVYNVLGRQNVYSVFFRNDKNMVKGYKLSVFGRPIPTVSFNFDF